MPRQQLSLFDRKLLGQALLESVFKLDPRVQWRNPVMFVVSIGTIVTAILYGQALAGHGEASPGFILAVTIWLLFTVLFANFAEALAEGRSRAQASALRNMRQTVMAKRIVQNRTGSRQTVLVKAEDLRKDDVGGRRRRCTASRQDRHHYARQSTSCGLSACAQRDRAGTGGCRSTRIARR
jgi:K+-transporting ATPase ATPase B chain